MRIELLNWSHAVEILDHGDNREIKNFIEETVISAPHFEFQGKSESRTAADRIDTCQEHLNRYFDYKISSTGWSLQPAISFGVNQPDLAPIQLKADFRKSFNNKMFQIEIQCGNNSRFYADLIKFQMAWLHKLTDVAILIVPMNTYALRMGENICNFERLGRELPYLRPVLQLPILVVGFEPDENTTRYNLKETSYRFLQAADLKEKDKYTRMKSMINRDRNIQALILNNSSIEDINEDYPVIRELIPTTEH